MNIFNSKKEKGFTLIELLVVISIISLLSSIVLASVQDARNKAKGTAFRQHVGEFIKAVELYKINEPNNLPPALDKTVARYSYYRINNDGSKLERDTNSDLSTDISQYIEALPTPPFSGNFYFIYTPLYECQGDTKTPDYMIWITGDENKKYFDDWPYATRGTSTYSCFSL
jgi:prepilin-type N-terminal cleavage/methylation domain-containing protein